MAKVSPVVFAYELRSVYLEKFNVPTKLDLSNKVTHLDTERIPLEENAHQILSFCLS